MRHLAICLFFGGITCFVFQGSQQRVTRGPLPSIPRTTVSPPNVTCRSQPFSRCFLGNCPEQYTCLSSDACCPDTDLIIPGGDCQDYLEGCENLDCNRIDTYEFALGNCRKTCNLCNNQPLPPRFNCDDILPDCKQRANDGLCHLKGFQTFAALYCPRSCEICDYVDPAVPCGDTFPNCQTDSDSFCNSRKTSPFQLRSGCGKTCGKC